jgi:hypothetical protein
MDTLVNLVNNPIFEQIVGYVLARQETRITKQVLLIARHMGLAEGWGKGCLLCFRSFLREIRLGSSMRLSRIYRCIYEVVSKN